jgi:hypothetical protein
MGLAGNYAILAKSGISTVPNSVITGNIGVSPIASTAMTGFSLTADATEEFSESAQLTGHAFAANYAVPTPTLLTTAVSDMETAYTDAAGRPSVDAAKVNLGSGILGDAGFGDRTTPLTTGVYTFGTGVTIDADIYFYGSDTDVFIIKMTGNLLQVANTKVTLVNGALAKNIFWQVAGHVEVGYGAHMEGNLLVKTAVLFKTGSSLYGRILAQTACDLQVATINA